MNAQLETIALQEAQVVQLILVLMVHIDLLCKELSLEIVLHVPLDIIVQNNQQIQSSVLLDITVVQAQQQVTQ